MTQHPARIGGDTVFHSGDRVVPPVGLLLAAGAGSRMGRPKALVRDEQGRPWLERAATLLADAGCSPVLVVLGASATEAQAHVPATAHVVVAEDWATGMSASLRAGLLAAAETVAETAVITLVDLPRLPVEAVRRVAAGSGRSTLRQAVFAGSPGHPVVIGRDHWSPLLAELAGDEGARPYLRANGVLLVDCTDLGSGDDADYPGDIVGLQAVAEPTGPPFGEDR